MLEAVAVLPRIARAAVRVGWLERRCDLPETIRRLRRDGRRDGRDPRIALGILERLLPILPPYGAGRCVKRSLLLLDLWSRAGLAPRIHFGIRRNGDRHEGHAWVTTRDGSFATFRPPDVLEAWSA